MKLTTTIFEPKQIEMEISAPVFYKSSAYEEYLAILEDKAIKLYRGNSLPMYANMQIITPEAAVKEIKSMDKSGKVEISEVEFILALSEVACLFSLD